MEFMYEYSAAHKFFLYLNSTPPTSSEATTSLVPPPPPPPAPPLEAYDQAAYYPTSSINDQELMMSLMNFQATDDHIHPPPQPLAEAAAPFIPYNQVQFSEGSSIMMDFSYMNEDIYSNNSYYFETSREAKVLRYKEKKKRRNYVKKIRYPSRKAYADRRPRIRGRFVKVSDEDEEPPIALNQYNQESTMAWPQYNQESTMAWPQYNTQNCS